MNKEIMSEINETKMPKIKIGIDLDCTLNNLLDVWLERYNKDYNDNLKDPKVWVMTDIVKPECGNKIYDYLHEPGFFYKLGIQDGAAEVMKWLCEKFEVYIVTAYFPDVCYDKVRWVQKYLPFFDIKNVIFCNNKGLLNLDYLVDDGGHNIEAFQQTGIILDCPYNRYLDDKKYPNRVSNWKEIKELFNWIEVNSELKFVNNYINNHFLKN
jgi:5'(3')-deoxyribonucleotidase